MKKFLTKYVRKKDRTSFFILVSSFLCFVIGFVLGNWMWDQTLPRPSPGPVPTVIPTETPTPSDNPSPSPTVRPSPSPTPTPTLPPVSNRPYTINVWLLVYRPQGDYVNETGDSIAFTKNTLLPAMNNASKYKGYENPQAQSSLRYILADENVHVEYNPPPHRANGQYDYEGLFQKYDLCAYATQHDIKTVILWADGLGEYGGGMWEAAITGSKGIPTNGEILSTCPGKTIVVYGLNYTRGLAEAMESYGHHLERAFQFYRPVYTSWADQDSCGNVHNPPNFRFEYDRENTASFSSDCRTWRSDGTGVKETLSCATWGCSAVTWIPWWMQNASADWWKIIGSPD